MTKKTKYWQKVNQMEVLYIAKKSIKWYNLLKTYLLIAISYIFKHTLVPWLMYKMYNLLKTYLLIAI